MDYFGYIDPGTGSLLVQALIGGILGAVFVLRSWIKNFFYNAKKFFSKSSKENSVSEEA